MASKGSNVDQKTPQQDAEARKAAQNRKRHTPRNHGLHTGPSILEETRMDRAAQHINAEARSLMDALEPIMCSSAPSANAAIKKAFVTFLETYVSVKGHELRDAGVHRTRYALDVALATIDDTLVAKWFKTQVMTTNGRLRKQSTVVTKTVEPTRQRELANA